MPRRCLLRSAVLALALGLLQLPTARAQAPAPPGGGFDIPVDCRMGAVCTVQNYIDHDPGPGWLDHTCGPLSYDGHRGIDFRVPTQIEMRQGVAVIAAADGKVVAVNDGQPDLLMMDTGPGKTLDERNGNWTAIDHGGGWVTTYAHLMKGSVTVKRGQHVKRGEKLGLIGLSGNSDFPHVHFAVTYRNLLLDPFVGMEPGAACGKAGTSLWSPAAQTALAYRAGGLLSAGFLGRQPSHREIMDGIVPPATVSATDPVLIFWTGAWGLREGDRLRLAVFDPRGEVFVKNEHVMDRNRATESRLIGRKRRGEPWPPGIYRGTYRVDREVAGTTVVIIDTAVEVEVR